MIEVLETDRGGGESITTRRKIIAFAVMGIIVFGFFGLLALGLMNKSPVTGKSGMTRVGKAAPNITMPLLDGGEFQMSEYAARPMVVNFWASWCPPCREESPGFERTWRRFSDSGLLIVGVDIQDSLEDGLAYIREFDLTFPNGVDLDGKITVEYGVIGLPVTFFIGADGIVKGRWVGALPEDRLVGWVESLIAGASNNFPHFLLARCGEHRLHSPAASL
ncbi:MAG: TlpA family protein disulfide reductase [Chloroflexi bacterium]|nr:TlpA family protein disulfide reductase [Chloroflexota bacterium]